MEERSPAEVVRLCQDEGVAIVDFRFCDLPGLMQHFSAPVHQLTEEGFEDGYGFDGSSIRGFQEIQESDMILVPDPNTAVLDPFLAVPIFLAVTSSHSSRSRAALVTVVSITVFAVLAVSALLGDTILSLVGASLAAFRVGGGLVLLLMALAMLNAQAGGVRHSAPPTARPQYHSAAN